MGYLELGKMDAALHISCVSLIQITGWISRGTKKVIFKSEGDRSSAHTFLHTFSQLFCLYTTAQKFKITSHIINTKVCADGTFKFKLYLYLLRNQNLNVSNQKCV